MKEIQSMRKEFTNCLLTGVLMEVNVMIQKRVFTTLFIQGNSYAGGMI